MEDDIGLVLVVLLILCLNSADTAVHGGGYFHIPAAPVAVDSDMEGGMHHILLLDIKVGVAEGGKDVGEDFFLGDAGVNLPVGETDRGKDGVEGLIEGLGGLLDLIVEGSPLGLQAGDEGLTLLALLEVTVVDEDLFILGNLGGQSLNIVQIALEFFLSPVERPGSQGVDRDGFRILLTSGLLIVVGEVGDLGEKGVVGGDDVNLLHGVMSFNWFLFLFCYKDTTKKRDHQIFLHFFTKKFT